MVCYKSEYTELTSLLFEMIRIIAQIRVEYLKDFKFQPNKCILMV